MNTAIPVLVALIGLILLGMMLAYYQRMVKEYHLKKYRSKDESFADMLNYAAVVDDGVIVCKNGSFMASFFFKGADNASATDQERELVSFRINKAIGRLGNGWMMHVDAIRNPAPSYSDRNASHFPDRVSAAVDEERRRLFEKLGQLYEGCFIVTFTWFPPALAESKFTELMFDDEREVSTDKDTTLNLIEKFKHEISIIQANLSQAVSIERLNGVMVRSLFLASRHVSGKTSFRLWRLKATPLNLIQAFSASWPSSHVNTAGLRALFSLILTKPYQN